MSAGLNAAMPPREVLTRPSLQLGDSRLMRDFYCLNVGEGVLSATVGDMANNPTDTTYVDEETARYRGLDPELSMNGALVGSIALQRHLAGVIASGGDFVHMANKIICDAHERLGVQRERGAERFTGYLAHAVVAADTVELTAVGDVNVWVNGRRLFDADHPLSGIIGSLLTDLVEKPSDWPQLVAKLDDHIQIGEETAQRLLDALSARAKPEPFTRQDAYLATSRVLTPWYMDRLQNTVNHPYSYGAIDGTVTPPRFIHHATLPTSDVDSLVIATDGLCPKSLDLSVSSLADLAPSNPQFGEQTAVDLSRFARSLKRSTI